MLNVRGVPETAGGHVCNSEQCHVYNSAQCYVCAGLYTCRVSSLAGNASVSTSLYVHGSVASVCSPDAG